MNNQQFEFLKSLNPQEERLFIVCPGRGTYIKETLGYYTHSKDLHYSPSTQKIWSDFDKMRIERGEISLSELDGMSNFDLQLHTKGENASALIYACSLCDYLTIKELGFKSVCVTGNSMGHYIALVVSGALSPYEGFELINTMGSMMKDGLLGSQVIYSFVDEQWLWDHQLEDEVDNIISNIQENNPDCEIYTSIELGGMKVFAGNNKGMSLLLKSLPVKKPYPFKLINHGAFHTPLLKDISNKAQNIFNEDFFKAPHFPLIDGNGKVWQKYSTDPKKLREYTLIDQVIDTFSFTKGMTVGIKEFAPTRIVLLGPGNTLGGAIGQVLVSHNWKGFTNKDLFKKQDQFLISLGMN